MSEISLDGAWQNGTHTMPDLVNRLLLRSIQLSVCDGVFFQEVTYLVAGGEKVVVADMIILSSSELRLMAY